MRETPEYSLDIVLAAGRKATESLGVDPEEWTRIFREELRHIVEDQVTGESEVSERYELDVSELNITSSYFSAFQILTRRGGDLSDSDWDLYKDGSWEDVMNQVLSEFPTLNKRELVGHVFVILQKEHDGSGLLICYGKAHQDHHRRNNPHFWFVRGEYDDLKKLLGEFKDPEKLKKFTQDTFDLYDYDDGPDERQEALGHAFSKTPYDRMKFLHLKDVENSEDLVSIEV